MEGAPGPRGGRKGAGGVIVHGAGQEGPYQVLPTAWPCLTICPLPPPPPLPICPFGPSPG